MELCRVFLEGLQRAFNSKVFGNIFDITQQLLCCVYLSLKKEIITWNHEIDFNLYDHDFLNTIQELSIKLSLKVIDKVIADMIAVLKALIVSFHTVNCKSIFLTLTTGDQWFTGDQLLTITDSDCVRDSLNSSRPTTGSRLIKPNVVRVISFKASSGKHRSYISQ